MFERICRENGITARLTKPRSPTTTGKIERWHGTLRRELLDVCGPFESMAAAQASIDAWVHAYNHGRPHQALSMVTPVSVFRPVPASEPPSAAAAPLPPPPGPAARPGRLPLPPRAGPGPAHEAVEIDMVITPSGRLCLPGNQQIKFNAALGGHPVTVWADLRSIHVLAGGELIRTRTSRLSPADLAQLRLHGARPAGPEPAPPAVPRGPLPAAAAVEIDRTVGCDGDIHLAGCRVTLEVNLAGQRVTLRLDNHLMHVIAAGRLVKTLPAPIIPAQVAKLTGARTTQQPLPPPPAPPLRAIRKIPADGITMVAGQRLRVGRAHAGKTVTVVIDDTVFRVLHNDIELSIHPRKSTEPIKKYRR